MKGMTKAAPGDSTRSNLPRRSTTQACCCGTMAIALMTIRIASATMTTRTMVEVSIMVCIPLLGWLPGRSARARRPGRPAGPGLARAAGCVPGREHQARAAQFGDDMLAAMGRVPLGQFSLPVSAAIPDAGRAVVGPGFHRHDLPDVQVDVGIAGRVDLALFSTRVLRKITSPSSTTTPQASSCHSRPAFSQAATPPPARPSATSSK